MFLVGAAHLAAVVDVLLGNRHLGIGVVHGVPGQAQFFVQLAQGVVADIQGLVGLVGLGLQLSLVAATGVQVEAHAQHGFPAVVVAGVAVDVVVGVTAQLGVETWVEGRLGGFVLFFGSGDIGFGRTQDRAVIEHLATRFIQVCRQQRHEAGRTLQLIGFLADGTEVVGLGVGQVGLLGDHVVTGLGQTGFSLVQVSPAADTALGAQFDLVVDALVVTQVVFGQTHELTTGQDVQVNLGYRQCSALGSAKQRKSAGVNGGLLTPYFTGGGKTVKNHLLQAQARFAAIEGVPMAATGASG